LIKSWQLKHDCLSLVLAFWDGRIVENYFDTQARLDCNTINLPRSKLCRHEYLSGGLLEGGRQSGLIARNALHLAALINKKGENANISTLNGRTWRAGKNDRCPGNGRYG
jgi:hypothetical protein